MEDVQRGSWAAGAGCAVCPSRPLLTHSVPLAPEPTGARDQSTRCYHCLYTRLQRFLEVESPSFHSSGIEKGLVSISGSGLKKQLHLVVVFLFFFFFSRQCVVTEADLEMTVYQKIALNF